MIKIDKKKYKVDSQNYYKTVKPKTKIILADSFRKDDFHIKRLEKKDMGKSKTWNTYTISRSGEIYEHFNPKYYSDYISNKEISRESITIVLENLGGLNYIDTGYYNWAGEELINYDQLHVEHWRGCEYWEKYTKEQFNSSIKLCKYLCEKFEIPKKTIGFNNYHIDSDKYNGVISVSNFDHKRDDINPSFDILKFKKILTDEWELKE